MRGATCSPFGEYFVTQRRASERRAPTRRFLRLAERAIEAPQDLRHRQATTALFRALPFSGRPTM